MFESMKVPEFLLKKETSNASQTFLEMVNNFSSYTQTINTLINSSQSMINDMIYDVIYPIKGGLKLKIKGKKILKIRKKIQFKKRERYAIF